MKVKTLVVSILLASVCSFAAADQIQFYLTGAQGDGLLPGNIDPPTSSTGSGDLGATGIFYDIDTNILSVDVEWGSGNGFSDLTGEVTLLHLHGPTASLPPDNFGEVNPDIIVNLAGSLNFNPSGTNGGLVDEFFLSNEEEEWLLQGRTYVNVHTAAYEFGEIRGYLLPVAGVPEPSTTFVIAVAAMTMTIRRRRTK